MPLFKTDWLSALWHAGSNLLKGHSTFFSHSWENCAQTGNWPMKKGLKKKRKEKSLKINKREEKKIKNQTN